MATTKNFEQDITDRIRARMKAEKERAKQTGNRATAEAMKQAIKEEDIFFTSKESDPPVGKVRLSALVPSWDYARGTMDPWVTVFDLSIYTEDERAMIPTVLAGYRPNQESLAQLAYSVENTDVPVWMSGDASVGKTSLAHYLAAITVRPFARLNFNGQIASEDFIGKQSYTGGELTWHDGIIPKMMRMKHGIMLLDEPTAAPAESQMNLQAVLERYGRLFLSGKPCDAADAYVSPAEDFHFLLADNTVGMGDSTGRFIGTQPQNSAWLDRMGTFIMVDWLSAKDEAAMLTGLYPVISNTLAEKIVSVANLLRAGMKQGQISVSMSMRVTQAWCMHAVNLRDVKQGFVLAFLNRLDNAAEREAAKEVYRNIFG
jgi:MoxR-like ATPase